MLYLFRKLTKFDFQKIKAVNQYLTFSRKKYGFNFGNIFKNSFYFSGYRHMNTIKREAHHVDFAMQLEAMGLWQWSIFVILHLQDPFLRSKLAKEILGNVTRLSTIVEILKILIQNFY